MVVEHLILAQNSSIDLDNNSLSVFQFLEDVTIHSPQPNVPLPVQMIVVLRRDLNEKELIQSGFKVRVFDPQNKEVFSKILPLEMKPEHRRSRLRLNFNLLLQLSGNYRAEVVLEKQPEVARSFEFFVNMVRSISTAQTPVQ